LLNTFRDPEDPGQGTSAPGGSEPKGEIDEPTYWRLFREQQSEIDKYKASRRRLTGIDVGPGYRYADLRGSPPGNFDTGRGKPGMRGGRLPTDPLIESSIEKQNSLAAIIRGFAEDRENDRVFRSNLSELSRIESDHSAAVRKFEENTDGLANRVSDFERSDRDISRRMHRVIDRVRNRAHELAAAYRDEMRRARPEYVSDDPSSRNDMMGGRLPVTEGDPPHSAPYNQTVFPGQVVPLPPRPDPGAVYLKNYTARMNAIKETMTPGGLDSKIVGVKPIHTSGDVFQHYFIHFVTK
jgi:hypothetical protein